MGVEDARMTSVKERERSGDVKISQELMNALFVNFPDFMSVVLFRCECRGQERRIH